MNALRIFKLLGLGLALALLTLALTDRGQIGLGKEEPFQTLKQVLVDDVLVVELKINFTVHDLYIYVEWAYKDGTTIKDIWYFEQTLKAGDTIPLYAPRRHANPWASLADVPVKGWHSYKYSKGEGRCTYRKLQITRCTWDGSYVRVLGTVRNTGTCCGSIACGYVAFAAIYDKDGNIMAANSSEKNYVMPGDTNNFAVGFAGFKLPRPVTSEQCWVFQGQWGWQWVRTIFPNEPVPSIPPGLKNVCPNE